MSQTDPNLALTYGWPLGENGWHTAMDANLKRLGALMHLGVKSRRTTTPPTNPIDGDRYLIPANATGAWIGKTDQLAVRINAAWEFYVPKVGWLAYIDDEGVLCAYQTPGWSTGLTL